MQYRRVSLVYFSPTCTTKQVLEHIARGMGPEEIQHIDLSLPAADTGTIDPVRGDVALVGVPVYAGRVPVLAAQRLKRVAGEGKPAAVVCVYGNRAYEDALVELKDLARECGFAPVAGGAFIGEHSFATDEIPIANGRPDENDADEARTFGVKVRNMLSSRPSVHDFSELQVPGNVPYKDRPPKKEAAPVADPEICILCGTCAENCPSGAIEIDEAVQADPKTCILCHACVKNCPTEAIAFQAPPLQELAVKLSRDCRERREPEIFLSTT